MPRRARLLLANTPIHIIQRGNNRQACFYAEDDCQLYLDWLEDYAREYECAVHAFVLMTNHVHLLLSSTDAAGPSRLMKRLGQRYVQYINRTYRRTGTLWEGRFRSCLTQEEQYVLACYRYIELNPVRADMVEHPAEYPWSSYRANAQGEEMPLITPHTLYTRLGHDAGRRQEAYRELFRHHLEPGVIEEIRNATNGGFVLGGESFKVQIAAALKRRVSPGKPGRPVRRQ
jgi:putative transposase